MREKILVVASFIVIFAFSSVDSAISPMVNELHSHFNVGMNQVLLLISYCTVGTVLGVFFGPALTAAVRVPRLLIIASLGLSISLVGFLVAPSFVLALVSRFVFGLSSGVIASCMWWLTFHGVSKNSYQAMVTVLMSARPLATAIGVPLAGMVAAKTQWSSPFWLITGFILVAGTALMLAMPKDDGTKSRLNLSGVFSDYAKAFQQPYASSYYLGFTINRMCYFGFYAFAGIWFIRHYQLTLLQISTALFLIGLGEAAVNFIVPTLLKVTGHAMLFTSSIVLSALVFVIFIGGALPLPLAVALITLFMLLDRIYCMAIVISIPQMFPQAQNKTIFGSLNTLTAWAGLTVISWFEGKFLTSLGLANIQYVLIGCFVVGSLLLYHVQYRTVLSQEPSLTKSS